MRQERGFTFLEVTFAGIVILIGMVAVANIFRAPLEIQPTLDSQYRENILAEQMLHNSAEWLTEGNTMQVGLANSPNVPIPYPYRDTYSIYGRLDSKPRQSSAADEHYLQDITLLIGAPAGAGGSGGGAAGTSVEVTIPGDNSADIAFVIDSSGSMNMIAAVVAALDGFVDYLVAEGVDWRISVSEMGGWSPGCCPHPYGNRSVDIFDWTRTNLDSNNNVAQIKQMIGWVGSNPGGSGAGNPGYGLGYKRVDPWASMLEVAHPDWDSPGDPGAPAGLGIERNGGPGGPQDDYVTRRAGVKFFEIVLTDTIPESGLYRDETYNSSGAESASLISVTNPPAPPGWISTGRDAANNPLFPVIGTDGTRCGRAASGSERPGFYGSQARENAVAALLASDPLIKIYMAIRPTTNFWPCDVLAGHTNRNGLTFYDDIMAATAGSSFNIQSPTLAIDIQFIATQIVQSLALQAVGTYVMGEAGQLTLARYSRVGAKPGF